MSDRTAVPRAGRFPARAEVEERIGRLAAGQHGVVARGQLMELGLSSPAIDRRLRSGRYRRLHLGVYLVLPMPLAHTRQMAAVLAGGAGAILSHVSAVRLWGWLPPCEQGDIDVGAVGRFVTRPGIRGHRLAALGPEDRALREGIPVTSPVRTLVDAAAVLGKRELENAIASAERERLVDADELARAMRRNRGHRGAQALGAVLRSPGGAVLTRSAAEDKLLDLIRKARLPTPRCNVSVGPYEVDFLWAQAGVAVEVDGYRWHGSRRQFESDRRKDADLAASGLTVVRLSWRQIAEEAMPTMVRIGQVLARAGERR